MRRPLLTLMLGLVILPLAVEGQVVPRRPAPVTRRDTLAGRDSLGRLRTDTTRDSALVKWTPPDSVMQQLLNRPGYTVTRYEGATVTFDAERRALRIVAGPKKEAAVQRGTQTVVTDSSIVYEESSKNATIHGTTIVLSDPSSGNADVHSTGTVTYNLAQRAARITNPRFPINLGEIWYITATDAKFVAGPPGPDSTRRTGDRAYAKGGTLTSCDDSIPDYHFEYGELKKTTGNTIVGRPAVLYIRDIPVLWLPFFFQDTRSGRRSGLIPPQFGVADIVRNSPNYRRRIEDLGWYFAINDYMDARFALDWLSNTGRASGDLPGFVKYKGEWNYNWLDRFLSGHIASDYTRLRDGSSNLAVNWNHNQEFSRSSRLSTSINYVTNTQVQRQATTNTYTALGTIRSSLTYSQKLGPASMQFGGTRTQYPGRKQIEQTLPTFSLTTGTLNLAPWLNWTPSLSYSVNQTLHIDQPFPLTTHFVPDGNGGLRTDTTNASTRNTSLSFDTPIRIFGFDLRNSFSVQDQRQDYPQSLPIYDVQTGNVVANRIFTRTYLTNVDWVPSFTMPSLGHNRFNISPSVSFQNVTGGPFWVRSHLTNGKFVHQTKRPSFSLSASPTIYGLLPGFGPFSRLRHAIQPTVSYSFAPSATVDTNYLKATNQTVRGTGLLSGLRQNTISFGLSQNFEAKVRPRGDSAAEGSGDKITLLSLQFGSLTYNIDQARTLHKPIRGLISDGWNYNARSDLLPGFTFSVNYSLFKGSPTSDTAVFSPYRTGISATMDLTNTQNPFAVLTRLFGRGAPARAPNTEQESLQRTDEELARQISSQPVAGSRASGRQFLTTPTEGWSLHLNFSSNRSRPLTGPNVVQFDPETQCAAFKSLPLAFEQCVLTKRTTPSGESPIDSPFAGGQIIQTPPVTTVGADTKFRLTEKWSAGWNTNYDVERHEFASHTVSLQRDLHDWRAVFGFTQSPNGAFAFTFFIALKAEPDLKFDYNRATYRNGAPITTP